MILIAGFGLSSWLLWLLNLKVLTAPQSFFALSVGVFLLAFLYRMQGDRKFLTISQVGLPLLFSFVPFVRYFFVPILNGPYSFGGYDWHAYAMIAKALLARLQGKILPIEATHSDIIMGLLEENVFAAYWPISLIHLLTGASWPLAALASQWLATFFLFWILQLSLKNLFQISDKALGVILGLIALNPYFSYLNSEAYVSQIWGMAYSFAFLNSQVFMSRKEGLTLHFTLGTFALIGLNLTYAHMLPVVGATGVLIYIQSLDLKSMRLRLLTYLKFFAPQCLLVFMASPYRAKLNLQNFLSLKNVSAGPSMDSQHAEAWLGVFFDPYFNKAPLLLEIAISLLFLWLLYKYTQNKKNDPYRYLPAGILAGILVLRILMKIEGSPSINYKTFKIISFFQPILIATFWVCIFELSKGSRRWRTLGVLIVFANVFNFYKFQNSMIRSPMKVGDRYSRFSEMDLKDKDLIFISPDSKNYDFNTHESMWLMLALSDTNVSPWNAIGMFNAKTLKGDLAVITDEQISKEGFAHYEIDTKTVCFYKGEEILYKKQFCQNFEKLPENAIKVRKTAEGLTTDMIVNHDFSK